MADRAFIRKILTDPKLRRMLQSDPIKVLGAQATKEEILAVRKVLKQVTSLEDQIEALGDLLLCTGDDPSPSRK